ncbi:MAG: SMI1/KNR4 family protein [Leptospiraceae bacterium]|nr:SMI1/KNR4 family protein [Leptospiraceae bacterium]
MIRIKANKQKIDEERVLKFESEFKLKLPDDYFEFLIQNNGGKPDLNILDVDNFGQININNFFGFDLKDKESNLEFCYDMFKNRIPIGILPIAESEGGNIICISLTKEVGSIYFWDHEMEADEGEKPDYSNMYKISDSFSSFIKRIEKFDPSKVEVNEKDVMNVWVDPEFLKDIKK